MKKIHILFLFSAVLTLISGSIMASSIETKTSQDESFKVTVVQPENGSVTVSPSLPSDSIVAAGTVITVTVTPNAGYAFDSGYYRVGRSGLEQGTNPVFKVTVDNNVTVGGSVIEASALEGFKVINDVVYAQPGVKKLKYDVYTPDGAENLPIIVIIHGGGWSSNIEDVMRGLSRELVRDGKYVVCNMDYRWIATGDGDEVPNTMNMLIEDVYGGIAHIMEHAAEYGGDPTRIAVTGDSAGGHLSACAADMTERIGDGGFFETEGVCEYMPTYIPAGKTVDQVRDEITAAIKVAAPSYGVFTEGMLGGGTRLEGFTQEQIAAVSPISNIPNVSERAVPQLLLRGTNDRLISDEEVQSYTDALEAAGQKVEYVLVEGAGHAFFDWKQDARTKATFAQYGVPYAAKMESFFDEVFY